MQPLVGILAGGKSIRMGTDKTLLKISGLSLRERAVGTALETGYEVAVSGCGQPEGWPFPDVSFVHFWEIDCRASLDDSQIIYSE